MLCSIIQFIVVVEDETRHKVMEKLGFSSLFVLKQHCNENDDDIMVVVVVAFVRVRFTEE